MFKKHVYVVPLAFGPRRPAALLGQANQITSPVLARQLTSYSAHRDSQCRVCSKTNPSLPVLPRVSPCIRQSGAAGPVGCVDARGGGKGLARPPVSTLPRASRCSRDRSRLVAAHGPMCALVRHRKESALRRATTLTDAHMLTLASAVLCLATQRGIRAPRSRIRSSGISPRSP